MKQCPRCNRTYPDDTLNFCLDDGTSLVTAYDPEATLADVVLDSKAPPKETLKWENECPEIIITNRGFSIGGYPLQFPMRVDQLEYILGEPNRRDSSNHLINTHYWDNLGIKCSETKESFEVWTIDFTLNRRFTKDETSKTFQGNLYVDDASVDSKSTASQVNRSKTGGKFSLAVPGILEANDIDPEIPISWYLKCENFKVALFTTKKEIIYSLNIVNDNAMPTLPKNIQDSLDALRNSK